LLWLLLLAIPLILHLVRPRARPVRTSTLAFFLGLDRRQQESPWLRWLKRLLALLLSASVVTAAVVALARPVLAPADDRLRAVVLLVDRSASMAAHDATGRSRLEQAVLAGQQRLAGLPAGCAITVIAHDARSEIIVAGTIDRREASRALGTLSVRPIAGDHATHASALALAGRLAAAATPAQVWDLSDAPLANDTAGSLPSGVTREAVVLALNEPVNAGISAADVRRRPLEPGQLDVYVEIAATLAPSASAEAVLVASIDEQEVALRTLSLTADAEGVCATQRLSFALDHPRGTTLHLALRLPGDQLELDNTVELRLPKLTPLHVVLVGDEPDPFLVIALAGLERAGGMRIERLAPAAWTATVTADVVVFHHWLPPTWPERALLVVDPPASLPPLAVTPINDGLPVDSPRAPDANHPVLFGVTSSRVSALQTAVLSGDGGLQPLWLSPAGALLLAGEVKTARAVVLAAAPSRSARLALTSAYPLLIANALLWTSEPARERRTGHRHRTGTLLPLTGHTLTWGDGTQVPLRGGMAALDRLGSWSTDGGDLGSAALLSLSESRLPRAMPGNIQATVALAGGWLGGDLLPVLVLLAFAVLLADVWLCHRWGVA
jgi:hypothetical protein